MIYSRISYNLSHVKTLRVKQSAILLRTTMGPATWGIFLAFFSEIARVPIVYTIVKMNNRDNSISIKNIENTCCCVLKYVHLTWPVGLKSDVAIWRSYKAEHDVRKTLTYNQGSHL